jgi:hypothetical protein
MKAFQRVIRYYMESETNLIFKQVCFEKKIQRKNTCNEKTASSIKLIMNIVVHSKTL